MTILKKDIPLGFIVYRGSSMIDGAPIRVIVTGIADTTVNEKTGNMLQTYIIRPDVFPCEAIKKDCGKDYSTCHNCPHRHWGSCYVNVAQAPTSIFKTYHRDRYVDFDFEKHSQFFEGRKIRVGSYGDPGAVPISVWKDICNLTSGHTGYTELWNTDIVDQDLKNYCMASVVTIKDKQKANKIGWRTFRVRPYDGEESCVKDNNCNLMAIESVLTDNEAKCPASKEAGVLTSCSKCGACMGIESKTKKNICITIHGLDYKIVKFRAGLKKKLHKKKCTTEFAYPVKKKK